ncbi:MAG: HPr(Ser) kinase/phosphatase [Pseudomonadota bacterium]
MEPAVTAEQLVEACHESLQLSWLQRPDQTITVAADPADTPERSLVGHLNFIHPHRIQVLGRRELSYLETLGKNSRSDALKQLFSPPSALVILADGLTLPESMQTHARHSGTAILGSPLGSTRVVRDIGDYLRQQLAQSAVVHGVFMEVLGMGVLLTGKSAIGKSELALELLTRGHRLIADDAPVFSQSSRPGRLYGHCPAVLENFLEVRGLGVLNIRAMFGDVAMRRRMALHLIVHLVPVELEQLQQLDRLNGTRRIRQILHTPVDEVELPVAPGRNLAVLVEAAARNQILYTNGYDAAQDFTQRQQQLMHSNPA